MGRRLFIFVGGGKLVEESEEGIKVHQRQRLDDDSVGILVGI
jgi:hypothetical protein